MPAKWHKYSYSAQIQERRSFMAVISLFLVLTVLFSLINRHLVTMYAIESSTMEPGLSVGNCVVSTPLYSNNPSQTSSLSLLIKPVRGDLVVVAPAYPDDRNFLLRSMNAIVSFLTFQKIRPFEPEFSWGEKPLIRRLVAFPGDSVYMEDFILHIKPAGSTHYLTEFEVAGRTYNLKLDALPENWTTGLPFSGSYPETRLGDTEFFVLCDNRLSASDSRVWGPVPATRISRKVLLRYWPFSHFGIP